MKAIKYIVSMIFVILVCATFYTYSLLSISKPIMSGEVIIGPDNGAKSQLINSVKILRDKEGIPHIYAKNDTDLYFALGFVMASDRLFQYDVIRRAGSGTTAEVFGAKTIEVDKLFRTFAAKKVFKEKIDQLPRHIKDELNAFCSGLNYYANNYPLPIEFKILNYRPKDFTIEDAYYVYTYLAYSFTPMLKEDLLHTEIANRLVKNNSDRDIKILNAMNEAPAKFSEKIISQIKDMNFNMLVDVDHILSHFGPIEGSNAWVISGQYSKSGKPILSSDPHITYSLPNLWYEAHLVNERTGHEVYGHFLPLIPYAAMSHNRKYGWGLTMSYGDDLDLYQEEIKEDKYYRNGKEKSLVFEKEIIKVKGQNDIELITPWTDRGPLADNILKTKNVSFHWAFHFADNHPLKAFRGMNYAKNMDEFKQAVAFGKSPGVNVLYADKEGNIGHFIFGAYLKRENSSYNNFVTPNELYPQGDYDYELKAHDINPDSGIIISTNDRPKNIKVDLRGSWYPKNRHDTTLNLLKKRSDWTMESMRDVQVSDLDIFALKYRDIILNDLLQSGYNFSQIEKEAIDKLRDWDGISSLESIGASIYHHFNFLFLPLVMDELSPDQIEKYSLSTASWYFHQRLMNDAKNTWWDNEKTSIRESRKEMILEVFKRTVGELKNQLGENISRWQWGKLHTITYPHPFGMSKLMAKFFNQGPYPISGGINIINHNRRKGIKEGHAVKSGPSTRRIIDFSTPELSFGILPLGISGHQLSPFFDNQKERFLKGEYRPQYLRKKDVEDNLYSTLLLKKI